MSPEKKPYQPTKEDIEEQNLFQRVLAHADKVAHGYNLEPQPSTALEEFATISLRIRQVTKDFQGKARTKKNYYVGTDENGKALAHKMSVLKYENFLKVHTRIAFNLYGEYLFPSDAARPAAKDIQDFIDEILPLRDHVSGRNS